MGSEMCIRDSILEEEPPALPGSPTLSALVTSMLAKNTADRPSAADVVRLIEAERRTLVRREGSLLLETHMSDTFGDQLAEKRHWLREQWAAVETGVQKSPDLQEPSVVPAAPKRRGHGKLIILLSALIAVGMIAFSALNRNQAPSTVIKALAPAAAPAPVDVVEVEPVPEQIEVEAAPAVEVEPTPSEPRTPRMRRVRMRNEEAPTKMGRDLWGW